MTPGKNKTVQMQKKTAALFKSETLSLGLGLIVSTQSVAESLPQTQGLPAPHHFSK